MGGCSLGKWTLKTDKQILKEKWFYCNRVFITTEDYFGQKLGIDRQPIFKKNIKVVRNLMALVLILTSDFFTLVQE